MDEYIHNAELRIEMAFGQCKRLSEVAALWATLRELVDCSAGLNIDRVAEYSNREVSLREYWTCDW